MIIKRKIPTIDEMLLVDIFKSLRPKQWMKNLFVFGPLLFSQNMFNVPYVLKTVLAFAIFCLLSGAVYIWNDLKDIEKDRFHPVKSKRPLASGRLKEPTALFACIILCLSGLIFAFLLERTFFIVAAVYVVIQFFYSTWLKHIVILDVVIIALGFLLRVSAGGAVINVELSEWLLICMFLLALFIALSKRRHELVFLEENASHHRSILGEYTPYLLDQMISVVTASTVVAYCLYTISDETVAKFGSSRLIFTVPFVLYGIFRYLYLIHKKGEGGSPEASLLKDKPFLIGILLWIASAIFILHVRI